MNGGVDIADGAVDRIVEVARDLEWDTGAAIGLLCDALAVLCNEIDGDPHSVFPHILDRFNALHVAKHRGPLQ